MFKFTDMHENELHNGDYIAFGKFPKLYRKIDHFEQSADFAYMYDDNTNILWSISLLRVADDWMMTCARASNLEKVSEEEYLQWIMEQ
jgi:hypothetical protein